MWGYGPSFSPRFKKRITLEQVTKQGDSPVVELKQDVMESRVLHPGYDVGIGRQQLPTLNITRDR